MAKYEKLKEYFENNPNAYNNPITLEELEKFLGMDRLPESYYNNNYYWNNSDCGIGKILNDMGIKAKLNQATITFERNEEKDEKEIKK